MSVYSAIPRRTDHNMAELGSHRSRFERRLLRPPVRFTVTSRATAKCGRKADR